MRFGDLKFDRVFAIRPGTTGEFVDASKIDQEAFGEIRENGTRWYGRDENHLAIVASIAETKQATAQDAKPAASGDSQAVRITTRVRMAWRYSDSTVQEAVA